MTLEARLVLLAQAIGTDIKTLTTSLGILNNLATTNKTSLVVALNEVLTAAQNAAASANAAATINDLVSSTETTYSSSKIMAEIGDAVAGVSAGADIDDVTPSLTTTFSSTKINTVVADAVAALVNGAGATLDTLNELATALGNDPSFAATITTALGNRVRVDAAQAFDGTQQAQGRSNIGAAAASDLTTLTTNVGDTDHNFVTDYNTAKA